MAFKIAGDSLMKQQAAQTQAVQDGFQTTTAAQTVPITDHQRSLVKLLDKKAKGSYLKTFQRSFSSSTLERNTKPTEDPSTMTIDFLRARLQSERADCRIEKEKAQRLARKVLELEHRLSMEVQLRKKAELQNLSRPSTKEQIMRARLSNSEGEEHPFRSKSCPSSMRNLDKYGPCAEAITSSQGRDNDFGHNGSCGSYNNVGSQRNHCLVAGRFSQEQHDESSSDNESCKEKSTERVSQQPTRLQKLLATTTETPDWLPAQLDFEAPKHFDCKSKHIEQEKRIPLNMGKKNDSTIELCQYETSSSGYSSRSIEENSSSSKHKLEEAKEIVELEDANVGRPYPDWEEDGRIKKCSVVHEKVDEWLSRTPKSVSRTCMAGRGRSPTVFIETPCDDVKENNVLNEGLTEHPTEGRSYGNLIQGWSMSGRDEVKESVLGFLSAFTVGEYENYLRQMVIENLQTHDIESRGNCSKQIRSISMCSQQGWRQDQQAGTIKGCDDGSSHQKDISMCSQQGWTIKGCDDGSNKWEEIVPSIHQTYPQMSSNAGGSNAYAANFQEGRISGGGKQERGQQNEAEQATSMDRYTNFVQQCHSGAGAQCGRNRGPPHSYEGSQSSSAPPPKPAAMQEECNGSIGCTAGEPYYRRPMDAGLDWVGRRGNRQPLGPITSRCEIPSRFFAETLPSSG